MLVKFQQNINSHFPFLKGKKIVIAISGGVDSVVLTHLFSELKNPVSLAHCNFKLRAKESDLDEEFVKNLASKLNIEAFTTSFRTKKFAKENKLSTQVAARELRYTWFQKLVKKHSFDYILTAHHADDNLETFLINLTRGSGLEGLIGIPAINGNIIRPLLSFSRNEILKYAKENNIEWREDKSNSETKYIRNKIRLEIVPKLKEINPSLLDSFSKTSGFLKESQQIIDDRVEQVSKKIISKDFSTASEITRIDIDKIQKLSNPKAYLYQFLKEYNFTEWNDVKDLLSAQSGKQIFSKTHRLIKDRNYLLLSVNSFSYEKSSFKIEENQTELSKPIHLKLEKVLEKSNEKENTVFVDFDLLNYPLIVRKWQKGDYFYPSGMQGKKKLSKYFKDEKLSILEKENIWLLCNSKNDIIWVIGKRQDNRFVVSKNSKNIIKLNTKS